MVRGDARGLKAAPHDFRLATEAGAIRASTAVVALGAWSNDILSPLGYNVPLGVKRGYHMHYGLQGNAMLSHTVLDSEGGYCLAPMTRGIRLTTGAEFARRDAPPTPVQVDACEVLARRILPLAERRDAYPWMGARPCLPDMLPVTGEAPHHKGLWLNFGHHHHGLTLAACTGRLLAEAMTGAPCFTDPGPYGMERFG
jgi:D-amino-acid dehydrogenase